MKYYIWTVLILIATSCKRDKVTKYHPDLCAWWIHYPSSNEKFYLFINSDGTGSSEWFKDDKFKGDTKTRTWYIKDDYLLFGKIAGKHARDSYKINSYPSVATYSFIDNHDTVNVGQKYIVLNNKTYKEH